MLLLMENPWPAIVAAACAAGLFGALWHRYRRWQALAGMVACVILMPVAYWIEAQIVTPRERVEEAVLEITRAFQRNDGDTLSELISRTSPQLQILAMAALMEIELSNDMRVRDLRVNMSGQDTRAVAMFRLNATVSLKNASFQEYQPTRWESTWQLEAGEWRLIKLQELDPITGRYLNRLGIVSLGLSSPGGN